MNLVRLEVILVTVIGSVISNACRFTYFKNVPLRQIGSFSGVRCPLEVFGGLKERGWSYLTALQSAAPTDKYETTYIDFSSNVFFTSHGSSEITLALSEMTLAARWCNFATASVISPLKV